jgi:NADPH:quinone reductase-like Zn-dependent oxidoreductase
VLRFERRERRRSDHPGGRLDAPGHLVLVGEEHGRELAGREPAAQAQQQRGLRIVTERGMAARDHETDLVGGDADGLGDGSVDHGPRFAWGWAGGRTGRGAGAGRIRENPRVRAWVVRGEGEPAEVLRLEDVPEPQPAHLDGLTLDLAGWVADPATLGRADPAEQARYEARRAAAAARPPYDDWVLLRVRVAALALPDVTMARGTYPVRVTRPYVTGQEAVGDVIAAPPGRADLVGRRVVAVCMQPWGSLAPVSVGVVPGERVVVLGAAGGLGSAMVQLAAARGAEVVAVVGSETKAAHVRSLGAHTAVVHGGEDVAGAARAAIGATLGGYPRDVMRAMESEAQDAVMTWWHAGVFRPVTTGVVPFEAVPAACSALAARRTRGRVVVEVGP